MRLVLGAVVRCRFPEQERPSQPGPKYRPAIVLGLHRTTEGRLFISLAKCTSQLAAYDKRHDVALHAAATLQEMGLTKPCLIRLSHVATIPYTSDWFGPRVTICGQVPAHLERVIVEHYNRAHLDGSIPPSPPFRQPLAAAPDHALAR